MSYDHNILLTSSYFALLGIWGLSGFILIPVSVNLVVTSTLILYIGCHRSLRLLLSEEHGGVPSSEKEILSAADAYKFPFFGSAALLSLYVAFKYFDKDMVNLLLSLYLSLIGIFTLTNTLSPFVSRIITNEKKFGYKFSFPLIGLVDLTFTLAEFTSLFLSIIFSVYYFKTKHFLMNNVLGISFCIQSIERISLGSYKIGAIALIGLFFYDIFWVFGTDVMVTVAKSFDGPIKLLFPRSLPTFDSKGEFSLLGLGDIVIPGLFVAILLRFDAVRAKVNPTKNAEHASFNKHYFNVNIISYAAGLVVTVLVMYFFKAAQPALLYLVPACLGSSLTVAAVRGEFQQLFSYDEESYNSLRDKQSNASANVNVNRLISEDSKNK
jgi:minor histocompatibility antigen H13